MNKKIKITAIQEPAIRYITTDGEKFDITPFGTTLTVDSYSCCMLYEPAGLSLHFLFIYTRSFVCYRIFSKTSRHTSQQKGGQRRFFFQKVFDTGACYHYENH